jgi:tRNA (cmo5U34)-methyltransferase
MGDYMQEVVEKFDVSSHFDAGLTERYDRRIRQFCPSYDALHQMIVPWLQGLPEQSTFLSAGAGTGSEIVTLGKSFPSWMFVAVDMSAEMLRVCKNQTAQAGVSDRVAFYNGQVQQYQSTIRFDAASSIFVSHFIQGREEKLAYFRSVAANLKPGGRFILADLFGDKDSSEFERLFNAWLLSYASHGASTEEMAKERAHAERDVDFIPERELCALLQDAGFATPVRFYQTFLFGGWVMVKNC